MYIYIYIYIMYTFSNNFWLSNRETMHMCNKRIWKIVYVALNYTKMISK